MDYVLTLVSYNTLSERTIDTVCYVLAQAGCLIGKTDPLSPKHAIDIELSEITPKKLKTLLKPFADKVQVDYHYQKAATRRKKVLFLDMDNTAIKGESLGLIMDKAGLSIEFRTILRSYKSGDDTFSTAFTKCMKHLRHKPATLIEEVVETLQMNKGCAELVKTMSANNFTTFIVTGGPKQVGDALAEKLGASGVFGNEAIIVDGKFNGTAIFDVKDAGSKESILLNTTGRLELHPKDAIAIGDNVNDGKILKTSGMGICYGDNPKLAMDAHTQIKFTDLKTALYFQGYHEDEIKK